jgi:hypothetical protein
MKRLILAVSAGLILAGCGGQGAQTAPGGGETLPIAPANGPVPQERIDGSALPEGFPKDVAATDRTLAVKAQEGGCGKASAEVKSQSPSAVELTLVETQPAVPQACTMDIRYPTVSVTLDQPLGERKVVLRFEQRTA